MKRGLLNFWHSWFANARLIGSIHFQVFWKNPIAYIAAARWFLVRKRVRARGRLAPLLGQSPNAYTYWSLRDQQGKKVLPVLKDPPIFALISKLGAEPGDLEATFRNLSAQGIVTLAVTAPVEAIDAIDWTSKPWILFMSAGDKLAPNAANKYREATDIAKADVIYADDDAYDRWGRRHAPHFKPDWNSELFAQFDYLTGSCLARCSPTSLAAHSGKPDWAAKLVNDALRQTGAYHLQEVLHHRKTRPAPPAKPKPLDVRVDLPSVSIIVPTRNRMELLSTCLEGLKSTRYPDVEVIIVDNDSDDPDALAYLAAIDPSFARVIRHPGAFNYSRINNLAAAEAKGQLLCLLNNDIEINSSDWLSILATQALRSDVGAVGPQLLYPDGRIQHAGVVIGVGNAAGHAHRLLRPEEEGYFRRHALPHFVSAVTGACLVVAREKFLAVGGLNEKDFAVAYNDVDLCLRLNQSGWQSLYEPRAVLVHHESVSRGFDRDPVGAARFAGELRALQDIWRTESIVDPFHHPQLSRASEQFVIAL